jgi:hypothetical protein
VRLIEFETANGPDVRVYLVATNDASDNETVTRAGFVDLGALKGTTGNQNYEIPDDLDLEKYRGVTVWCRRFGMNFATAPLTLQKQIEVSVESQGSPRLHSNEGVSPVSKGAATLQLQASGS